MSLDWSVRQTTSIRDQWAHQHAVRGFKYIYNRSPSLPSGLLSGPRHLGPEDPLPKLPPPPEAPRVRKPIRPSRPEDEGEPIKIGIVGAGAAGLFTAMIFDYLNSLNLKDYGTEKIFHVEYDILEAAGPDRVGGRLFTYDFKASSSSPKGPHDYYDVGAMRFPDNPVMKRQEI